MANDTPTPQPSTSQPQQTTVNQPQPTEWPKPNTSSDNEMMKGIDSSPLIKK